MAWYCILAKAPDPCVACCCVQAACRHEFVVKTEHLCMIYDVWNGEA
jgi:hypothetical protein